MLIHKMLSLGDVSLKMNGDSLTFDGYASAFGGIDSYGDTIERGAFSETLAKNGSPKMFFNHDWSMPIGKYQSVTEDDHGLFVRGEFTPGLSLAADVRAAMKHGTIDGLSIGGYLKKGDYTETDTGRSIKKWSSLVEISPVIFPADGAARIDLSTVKSADISDAIDGIETVRELERFLRDVGGLSKGASVSLVARAKNIFSGEGEPAGDIEAKALADLSARIHRLTALGERFK